MTISAIHRTLCSILTAVLLPAAAACGGAGEAAQPRHPERLDGAWSLEFRLEHPITATPPTPRHAPAVRGSVVLMENAPPASALPESATHYGAFAADLRPLGAVAQPGVPTLVARMVGADSVEFTLDPGSSRPLRAAGALRGDSVAGRWWTDGGRVAGGSSGHFVLRRP